MPHPSPPTLPTWSTIHQQPLQVYLMTQKGFFAPPNCSPQLRNPYLCATQHGHGQPQLGSLWAPSPFGPNGEAAAGGHHAGLSWLELLPNTPCMEGTRSTVGLGGNLGPILSALMLAEGLRRSVRRGRGRPPYTWSRHFWNVPESSGSHALRAQLRHSGVWWHPWGNELQNRQKQHMAGSEGKKWESPHLKGVIQCIIKGRSLNLA